MKTLQNRVQLIGRLGQDPEIKTFEDGKQMARFSLATSDTYRNAEGQKVEDTQWHKMVAWGKTAEIAAKYLKKGKQIAVDGKLTHRNYEDKDGVKKYISEVIINELLMLGSPNGDSKS